MKESKNKDMDDKNFSIDDYYKRQEIANASSREDKAISVGEDADTGYVKNEYLGPSTRGPSDSAPQIDVGPGLADRDGRQRKPL